MNQSTRGSDTAYRLLIVDDEPVMLAFLEAYLSRKFVTKSCTGGKEALEILDHGFRPDLILVDLQMPEMDGYELIRRVRDLPSNENAPIMVLSGSDKSADRVACLKLGAADFLVKPFNPDELEVRLNKITALHSLQNRSKYALV